MPTYEKNPREVVNLAAEVLSMHATHQPLLDAKVKIDYLFAFPKYDEKGNPVGDAIKQHGVKALGLAKVVSLKDRVKGNGDAEIIVDAEWWKVSEDKSRKALLDHELHHLSLKTNKHGKVDTDDINRPKIILRKHDWQFGWFNLIAERNGVHSLERQQATEIAQESGQLYWPSFVNATGGRTSKLEVANTRA